MKLAKKMAVMRKINCREFKRVIGVSEWDLSNQILYEMCQKYPRHETNKEIIAKVLLIGRVYSAAIERRKQVNNSSDIFYLREVAPAIKKSKIDIWLDSLNGFEYPTDENCPQIIAVHKKVTNLFEKISGLGKRSLASKYLHFHLPGLFFIYDTRASSALRQIEKSPVLFPKLLDYDIAYARFFLRCKAFVERVNSECRTRLTPRQLDKYLLS